VAVRGRERSAESFEAMGLPDRRMPILPVPPVSLGLMNGEALKTIVRPPGQKASISFRAVSGISSTSLLTIFLSPMMSGRGLLNSPTFEGVNPLYRLFMVRIRSQPVEGFRRVGHHTAFFQDGDGLQEGIFIGV